MAVTQYIGARYVPIFADPIEWSNTKTYEPLTIVTYQGNSYTSRCYVPKDIDIENEYYWAITGNYNAQVEEYARVARDTLRQIQAIGALIPTESFSAENTVNDVINSLSERLTAMGAKIEGFVTPEMYGAVGDGVTDDTNAVMQAFTSGMTVICNPNATYFTETGIAIDGASNTYIMGNNAHITAPNDNVAIPVLSFKRSSNIFISSLNVHAQDEQTVVVLNTHAPHGIEIDDNCTNIYIVNCTLHNLCDGISANRTSGMFILQNNVYHVGQEPCAMRWNDNAICALNAFHDHGGDGILIKAYLKDGYSNIVVANNTVFDGVHRQNGNSGGGITCNAEGITSGYITKGVIIANNILTNVRYGIIITNAEGFLIANNYVAPHTNPNDGTFYNGTACYAIHTNRDMNPEVPNTNKDILFIGNTAVGGLIQFRTYSNVNTDIAVENIMFIGNVGLPHSTARGTRAIQCKNSTFISNVIKTNGYQVADCYDCDFFNNKFESKNYTAANPQTSDIYFRGDVKASIKGNILQVPYVYMNALLGVFSENTMFNSGNETHPMKFATDATNGSVFVNNNTINGAPVTRGQVYLAQPDKIHTDFYRKTNILSDVSGHENEVVGYVLKNNSQTFVQIDGPFITSGRFAHLETTAFFKPPEYKQLIAFIRDANDQNIGVARCSFTTEGAFAMRESYNYSEGSTIVMGTFLNEI